MGEIIVFSSPVKRDGNENDYPICNSFVIQARDTLINKAKDEDKNEKDRVFVFVRMNEEELP